MNELIKFKFKANRNYIHGSDIFNNVSAFLGAEEYIKDISFRKFTNKHCILKSTEKVDEKAICKIKTNNSSYVLVETNETADSHYEFDEDGLVNDSLIVENEIKMDFDVKYSIIENIIALTKKLNYYIEPIVDGKWMFGQLKLSQTLPLSLKNIQITSTRRISNKFSENEVNIDGKVYGKILFIVGAP